MKINFEEGFKRVTIAISVIIALFSIMCIGDGAETILYGGLAIAIVWGIYYGIKWIIKGFIK